MPFQSEKQRRYMHANLPELAQRWEQEYARGGIARLPLAIPPNTTVGEEMIAMGTPLQNQMAKVMQKDIDASKMSGFKNQDYESYKNQMELLGGTEVTPYEFKGLQKGTITEPGTYKKASLNDPYADIKGYTADSGMFANDAYSGIGQGTTGGIGDMETTTLNKVPQPFDAFQDAEDKGYGQFFRDQPVDEVVSRSFKDHDNFMSWYRANPEVGETITRKAREFFEGGKELYETGKEKIGTGYNWLKDAAMTGIGKAINFPIGLLSGAASFRNPLNQKSANYNPYLSGQIDYLNKQGALGGSSGPYKIRRGVLAGKNLVSGFGTNDYGQMLQKRIDYFNKQKAKKGALTIAQNKKLQDTIAEKKRADQLATSQEASLRQQVRQQSEANRATGEGGWGSSFGSNEGFMTDTAEMGSFAHGGLASLWPRR